MRFVNYAVENGGALGFQDTDGAVFPLGEVLPDGVRTMQDLVDCYGTDFDKLKELVRRVQKDIHPLPAEATTLLSPFEETRHDLICVGLNYKDHVNETNRAFKTDYELPKVPVYFSKRVSAPRGHQGVIERHAGLTEKLDYESELGVVMGRGGREIPREEAMAHVFGYTIINDVSARDLQQLHNQWYRGKSLDTFVAMGPCVVTADEIPDPHVLDISCVVNGEVRQKSCTDMFIFNIDELIANFSTGITLDAGDIIATGTPSGVGMGLTPPKFLKSGDIVECRVQHIGSLTVTVG